jgi:hypothetical protein
MIEIINSSQMKASAKNSGALSMAIFRIGKSTTYSYTFIRKRINIRIDEYNGLLIVLKCLSY